MQESWGDIGRGLQARSSAPQVRLLLLHQRNSALADDSARAKAVYFCAWQCCLVSDPDICCPCACI